MEMTLNTILTNNKVEARFFTHVSQGTIKGKYQLNRHVLENMFDVYTEKVLVEQDKSSIELGISEVVQVSLPVLVDVDIKILEEEYEDIKDNLYTIEQVEQLIATYQAVLRKILERCDERDLMCVVLEKPAYRTIKNDKTYLKNGFHLHFPGVFMLKKDQKAHLIPRIKEEVKRLNIFSNITEDSSTLIDDGYLVSPWLMYGSSKGEGKDPYKITRVYDSECEKVKLEKAFSGYHIYDEQEKLIHLKSDNIHKHLIRIMSIFPQNRTPKNVKVNIVSPLKQQMRERQSSKFQSMDVKNAIIVAKELVPLINSQRVDNHNDWITIGWALFNCTEGSVEGFNIWNEFSARGEEPRGEARCLYEWGVMKRNVYNYTLGTIHYFAGLDSPEDYKKYKINQAEHFIERSIDGSHTDIARLIKNEYINEFVCASIENKVWYRFVEPIWEPMDSGVYLRRKIPDLETIYASIQKQNSASLQEAMDSNSQSDVAKYQKKQDLIQKLKKNIKSTPFKNNIMRECVHEDTLVSLANGTSMRIKNLNFPYTDSILGWSEEHKGMVAEPQNALIPKGTRECFHVILEDGTCLTATSDHKLLTETGKWITVHNLNPGLTRLKCGPKYPEVDYTREHAIANWKLNSEYNTSSYDGYMKTLAYTRILGYIGADIDNIKQLDNPELVLWFRTLLDIENFVKDLFLLNVSVDEYKIVTLIDPKPSMCKNVFTVTLSGQFIKNILSMFFDKDTSLYIPKFLYDPLCPREVVFEFIAGMYSKYGTLCEDKNDIYSVCFMKKAEHHSLYLLHHITKILRIADITDTYVKNEHHDNVLYNVLYIRPKYLTLFHDKIAFRYCSTKSNLLMVVNSYNNMIMEKYNALVEDEDNQENMSFGKRLYRRIFSSTSNYGIESFPILHHDILSNKKLSAHFPKFKTYLKNVGVFTQFTTQQNNSYMWNMNLKVVSVIPAGYKKVYDITVGRVHNFVANGIIAHNCQDEFYDPRFKEKLDVNPYLIAFKNGVYDLEKNLFRKGRPEDFLSKTMNVNYREYMDTDEEVEEVYNFLERIFPDKSLYRYFLDIASDVFVGGNHQKKVYFWLGSGDNGKSILQKLMELMLGKLAIKFDTNLITGKKPGSGSAHAELARAGGGVRWATLDEPNKDEQINSGILKKLSGNDSYWARDLFERGKDTREIHPLFKLNFVCLAGNTSVTLTDGTSISIEKLSTYGNDVLAWCKKNDGLKYTTQHAWLDKGTRDCVKLMLQDNTTITCTPDHRFLTADGKWIRACNVLPGSTRLKMGLTGVNCDDMIMDYDYTLHTNDVMVYNLNNQTARNMAAIYARVMGYLIASSHQTMLSFKYKWDVLSFCRDIETLFNIDLPYQRIENYYCIPIKTIPLKIPKTLPKFIKDPDCPLFVIREFIAGMFGKAGTIFMFLKMNCDISIKYNSEDYDENTKTILLDVVNILKNRFWINSTTESIYKNTKTSPQLNIKFVDIENTHKFISNIGFRYCIYKTYKSMALDKLLTFKNTNCCYQLPTVVYAILQEFLHSTGLDKFCTEDFRNNCSILSRDYLPTYTMKVTNIVNTNPQPVYDLCINEQYSNFIAEGIITHNCNKLPHIRYADKAVWNRVRVLLFETTFCRPGDPDNVAPESYEQQLREKRFPMDLDLEKKLPAMAEPFAWILLQHRLQVTSRIEPEKVMLATNVYKRQVDNYRQFIEENIVEDDKGIISLTVLYETFKEWFRQSYPGQSVQPRPEFMEYFETIWGTPDKSNRWVGYRLRTVQDDVDDGNAIVIDLPEAENTAF